MNLGKGPRIVAEISPPKKKRLLDEESVPVYIKAEKVTT